MLAGGLDVLRLPALATGCTGWYKIIAKPDDEVNKKILRGTKKSQTHEKRGRGKPGRLGDRRSVKVATHTPYAGSAVTAPSLDMRFPRWNAYLALGSPAS